MRLAFGLSIFAHGYNKVFGKGGLNRTARWFARMGMRAPKLQARLAALTEISGGIALAMGFATPIAAAALIALMVVAIVVAHRNNGYFIFRPGQGWALNFNYTNWFSLTIAIGLGFGSAIAQLAVFWRPPPTSESN